MNEKLIEKKLVKYVQGLGGWALKFWPITFTGFPDRIVLLPGARIWFVELKTTGKDLNPRQKIVIPHLIKLGFRVRIVDTPETLLSFTIEIENDLRAT